tara:strand:+ start:20 stop:292 length:273 start_codon:yes stop_codon:yes gene_type:complete
MKITETKQNFLKNPNTKTTYFLTSEHTKEIPAYEYKDTTSEDTIKYLRRLGGSEYVERGYTSVGYMVYKITSTSPDKQKKTIREYKFKNK